MSKITPSLCAALALLIAGPGIASANPNETYAGLGAPAAPKAGFVWHDAAQWQPGGRAWDDTPSPFSRLPRHAEAAVKEANKNVWRLAENSAGLVFYFRTDATTIRTRTTVANEVTAPHMTSIARSGLDLYARDDAGQWRWAGTTRPKKDDKIHEANIISGLEKKTRDYALYLPLYNTVVSLEIGVPEGAKIKPLPPPAARPIVYYGTSIAHGCSASRPGMALPAWLGRRLDIPVINLAFSGNGKMEPAVVDLVAEIDAAVFVLDCLPNMSSLKPEVISERLENCLRSLRAKHPKTPILLLEDRTYSHAWLFPKLQEKHRLARDANRSTYEKLVREGLTGVAYIPGANLFGTDGEGTVDGSHPGDLAMFRQAEIMLPALKQLLKK